MIVEVASPHMRWKPPLTEVFAMSAALLNSSCLKVLVLFSGLQTLGVGSLIIFGREYLIFSGFCKISD